MEENITDKLEAYLKDLGERYKYYYEVERDKEIYGVKVDIFAKSSTEHFRQVLTKNIKIDKHYTKEYAMVKALSGLGNKNEVKEFSQFLISSINKLSPPSVDTMSTILNGILVSTSGFSEEAIRFGEKFKFSRSFLLGIKGWCDIRLILVDLKGKKLYSNKKGKEVLSAYKIKSKSGLGGDKT
ncbi:MAG TPA: hypothetical protein DCK79_04810 [Candidatus Atribacteria bacterium]|nr:hypothetical protein [Candidatus Atribacteria bacterium]